MLGTIIAKLRAVTGQQDLHPGSVRDVCQDIRLEKVAVAAVGDPGSARCSGVGRTAEDGCEPTGEGDIIRGIPDEAGG